MLEPGAVVDRYAVVGVIGHGGMASVYHVRHTRLSSDHVLKVISLPGRGIRERLLLEGQVQAKLKHRNVVEVTDVIEVQGSPGLVMELVRGPSLDELLAAGRLPLDIVEALVPGLLAGVAAAHHEGVVHRDLKPANVLLAVRRGVVVPKVADFGLVKVAADESGRPKTRTGATMGTPQYMAPEQIQSAKDVDGRADVFALGAILYELVSGRRAFDGDSHYDVFQKVVARDYAPLSEVCPEAPARMVRAIDAALSDVSERPADPEALWALWRDDDTPLEVAAGRSAPWPESLVAQLTELAPSLADAPDSGGSATSGSETFVTVPPASEPTIDLGPEPVVNLAPAASSPPAPSLPPVGWRRVGIALGSLGLVGVFAALALVAVLLVWLLGGGQLLRVNVNPGSKAGGEQGRVEPIQPEAAPEPEPEPEPEPQPEPAAAPEPAPEPAKGKSKPKTKPRPAPPTGPATGAVRIDGPVPVTLQRDGKTWSPGELAPGTYKVWAEFTKGGAFAGSFELAAGETVTVRCVDAITRCEVLR